MHDIDTSCPTDLQPYADAYNLDKKQRDNEMWMWFGTYGLSAVSVAVEHCLAGRKAKSKYIKKPINEQQGKDDSEMTEEEIKKQSRRNRQLGIIRISRSARILPWRSRSGFREMEGKSPVFPCGNGGSAIQISVCRK